MRLPWECHDQSQETNLRHCVIGPERSFFHKRKGTLKTDQSKKGRDIGLVWELHALTHRLLIWTNLTFSVLRNIPF